MNLNCKITELIMADFNSLWRCSQRGETLEISTPYRMPDSTLFSLFLTERDSRFIASDGGGIAELLMEHSYLPEEEWKRELSALAKVHGLIEGSNEGIPIFFKDCREEKIISSISFDVANFATMAANLLISVEEVEEQAKETDSRFQSPGAGKGTVATLLLDTEGTRKIVLHGPASITPAELERFKGWAGFQFIVQDSK